LWRGEGEGYEALPEPMTSPRQIDREGRESALQVFEHLKRQSFFFDETIDVEASLRETSDVAAYQELLEAALQGDDRRVLEGVVGCINRYRSGVNVDREMILSRHHMLNATSRPTVYVSQANRSVDDLVLRVPYGVSSRKWPRAGFHPRRLLVSWDEAQGLPLVLDYQSWKTLNSRRSARVDRDQEALDNTLDAFIARARVRPSESSEVQFISPLQGRRKKYKVTATSARRGIEVRDS